jgi:hypothetical protein
MTKHQWDVMENQDLVEFTTLWLCSDASKFVTGVMV